MTIATLDQYIAAASQRVGILKTASVTAVALMDTQVLQAAGNPGAGTLAGASTAAGIVQTDATAGFPTINAFGGGATGYISSISYAASVACRIKLFDCLFKAGAYAFTAATTTLAAQPSYSSRVLGGTDFTNTEIWVEAVTAFTGTPILTITYTNQAGVAAHTTGAVTWVATPAVARMVQIPLAAGDTGVQKIESVTISGATAGTWNVLVMRRLWSGRVNIPNDGGVHDIFKTGMPQIFADSALMPIIQPDSTATGIVDLQIEIVNA